MNQFIKKVIEDSKIQSEESVKAVYERVRLDFQDANNYPDHANARIRGLLPTHENLKSSQVVVKLI